MDASSVDLPAYWQRIGITPPTGASMDTLTRIIAAHARTIPFENIDGLVGRPISLATASLQGKLVQRQRGGYCYEQNSLLLAVLTTLGFDLQAIEARVRAGVPDGVVTARSHMALRVTLDGIHYLVDVGFGGLAPLAPLVMHEPRPQSVPGSRYRWVESPDESLLQVETSQGFSDCYSVIDRELHAVDREVGNWHASTWPAFALKNNLLVGRVVGNERWTLWNRQLSRRNLATGGSVESLVMRRAELADLLADGFGIDVAPGDVDAVYAIIEPIPPRPDTVAAPAAP